MSESASEKEERKEAGIPPIDERHMRRIIQEIRPDAAADTIAPELLRKIAEEIMEELSKSL